MKAKRQIFVTCARSTSLDHRPITRHLAGGVICDTANVVSFPSASAVKPNKASADTGVPTSGAQSSSESPIARDSGMHGEPPTPKQKRLITIAEVLRRVPVSRRTIADWEQSESFPRRVMLPNGQGYWLEHEVDHWIETNNRKHRHDND